MQKSLFFMKTLRCTAGELYDTHKGTFALDFGGAGGGKDWIFAPFDLEIIHIDKAANSVFFQSIFEVETPNFSGFVCGRFAHCDDLPENCKIGAIIRQGEAFYKEGGKAGGVKGKYANHLHAVFASGRLIYPYWYNVGNGNFAMKSDGQPLHIYDAVFVPDDVEIVKTNDYKDEYPWRREEKKVNFEIFWEDENYKLTAIESGDPISIGKADFSSFGDVAALAGGPFFINQSGSEYGTILGRLQGLNCNRTTDQAFFDVAIDENDVAHRGRLASWEYKDARFGFSPRMMLIAGGVYSNESGEALAAFSDSYTDNFVFIVQDWSNRLGLGITKSKVSISSLRNHFLNEQMQYLWLCDGGGSTIAKAGGKIVAPEGASRKLPAFFALVRKKDPEPISGTMVFKCTKASTANGYPLRESAPSGKIVDYLKPGDFVKVVDIRNKGKNQYTSWAEPWCKTEDGLWFSFDKNYFE